MKYRVWDNENNQYFQPTYEAYNGKVEELLMDQSGRLCIRTLKGMTDESMFPGRFVVEHYFGEICETPVFVGDILLDVVSNKSYQVLWDEFAAMVLFQPVGEPLGNAIDYYELEESVAFSVVEGNVRENPHLLEDKP